MLGNYTKYLDFPFYFRVMFNSEMRSAFDFADTFFGCNGGNLGSWGLGI